MKNIGICCTSIHKEPVKPVIDELAQLIKNSSEYRMIVYQCFEDLFFGDKNDIGAKSIFSVINYDMLDAMIIFPCAYHDRSVVQGVVENCKKHNVPFVTIDEKVDGGFRVYFGYGEVFGNIVEHVLTVHNCRRIKLVAGLRGNEFSQTRIDSCANVMAKHGLFLEEKDIMYGDFWETPTYEAMDAFFASGEELPDAFICCNDSMAIAVCSKLNEHGYSVPQDVIVTGFDGIEMEKYHSPRLCTAFQNNKELAKEIIDILDKLSKDKNTEPFEKQLFYTAVFSESCGCKAHDGELSNRNLISFVQHYLSRNFEEHMDGMENNVTSDPVPEKVREVLRKFCFGRSAVCMTESFLKLLGENNESSSTDNNSYPQEMTLFTSTYEDGSQPEDAKFSSNQLLPDIDRAFGEYNMIYVIPMHFQDIVIGYYTTPYCPTEHHNEMLYTYTMTLDRCLETMRSHAHMLSLNRRLGFLFTHDQLTGIYNRYGFYSNFKNEAIRSGAKKSVFIVSADLNDMKYINDTFGHSAGDTALTITAQALQGAADGDEDVICARFGGDEFVVAKICEDSAAEYGERYRKNFRNVLDKLNSESGNPFEVHVSIGVYSAELSGDESIDELIEFADKLMYTDKALHKRKPRNMPKDLAINEV